jgi:DNA replication protein DnaC
MTITTLQQLCAQLQLSMIKQQLPDYIKQAERQKVTYQDFLLELLQLEIDSRRERRAARRVKEARFPMVKTLDGFHFSRSPHLPEALIYQLSKGDYINNAEPIILIGEPGTGKTHLACALGYAAAHDGHSVRFITASQLVNLLVEAKDSRVLSSITSRFARYKLLIIDELGYLPLSKADSELLFQVITQRQEILPTIITTNLPFSEWTAVFPDQRLCKAFIDRITHRAHIIESGEKSVRLEDTMKKIAKKGDK